MGIRSAVGIKGVKKGGEVGVIQSLLNARYADTPAFQVAVDKVIPANERAGTKLLREDNDCGERTTKAIVAFQKAVVKMANPDGTVEPNGTTWKALNGNTVQPRPMVNQNVNGYLPLSQLDYADALGNQEDISISSQGCALTVLTMAATAIGKRTEKWPTELQPKDLTPPKANKILKESGAFSQNSQSIAMSKGADALGMGYVEYGRSKDLTDSDVVNFNNHLAKGLPIAAHVDYNVSPAGDHWVLVTQKNVDGTYVAIDPSGGKKFFMKARVDPGENKRVEKLHGSKGKLFGYKGGQGTAGPLTQSHEQQYIMVRFGLLSPKY
jgi:hypothetical protein